jgi:hypothetical protein
MQLGSYLPRSIFSILPQLSLFLTALIFPVLRIRDCESNHGPVCSSVRPQVYQRWVLSLIECRACYRRLHRVFAITELMSTTGTDSVVMEPIGQCR